MNINISVLLIGQDNIQSSAISIDLLGIGHCRIETELGHLSS